MNAMTVLTEWICRSFEFLLSHPSNYINQNRKHYHKHKTYRDYTEKFSKYYAEMLNISLYGLQLRQSRHSSPGIPLDF